MSILVKLSKSISKLISYKEINKLTTKKLRNRKIGLMDLIKTFFQYTSLGSTHQSVTSKLNMKTIHSISRQALIKKQENIPLEFFQNMLQLIIKESANLYVLDPIIAVDGTYNNRHDGQVMSNLGLFDINNNIPVELKFAGAKRNGEVKEIINYIKQHIDTFKHAIVVCDRGYYSFEFINFLIKHNIRYIIRVKKEGDTLNPDVPIKKYAAKRDIIKNIRKTSRIVKCENVHKKRVTIRRNKSVLIHVKNNCTVVTDLDVNKYSDLDILDLYKRRWDVEVFFKLIKYNFKFQNMTERNEEKYKKMYIVELILVHLEKIIENEYMKDKAKTSTICKNGKNVACTFKINKSNVIKGLLETDILDDILNGKLTNIKIKKFKFAYIKIKKNAIGRSFPRQSKSPFSKWHLKGYSETSKYSKIVLALINNKVGDLNKNLKLIAKRIVKIGRRKYN